MNQDSTLSSSRISLDSARAFADATLQALNVPADIAADVAEHLIESDRVGYASHGLSILPHYARMLESQEVKPDGRAQPMADHDTWLSFDGEMGLGQHVGKTVIEQGIKRAKEKGQCVVTLKQSHHLGRLGHYGEMVADEGLILLSFTNVVGRPPTVAPYHGAEARLTTNPLCFAGPMANGRPHFVVDFATSSMAANRARVLASKGLQAPPNSLIDGEGHPTNDPAALFANPPGALLPFGAHKGYSLGLVAELLAGILSGGGTIQPAHYRGKAVRNNMFALIISPEFAGEKQWQIDEMGAFTEYLLACRPIDPKEPVQYPGQYEASNRSNNMDSIDVTASARQELSELGARVGVAFPAGL